MSDSPNIMCVISTVPKNGICDINSSPNFAQVTLAVLRILHVMSMVLLIIQRHISDSPNLICDTQCSL